MSESGGRFEIGAYRDALDATTFSHLRACAAALAAKDYLASSVWASVFVEALISDLMDRLSIPRASRDDLNERIQQLQRFHKKEGAAGPSIPDEVLKRFNNIRDTRNRLVHDTGLEKTTLRQDAEYVCGSLKVVLDWYVRELAPARPAPAEGPGAGAQDRVPVFLSTINTENDRQACFLEWFLHRLRAIGIEPVRVQMTSYDKRDPFAKTREAIRRCQGMIVIGLERTHSYFLRDKEGTPREKEDTHRKYTSGWLHLEAGMANAFGIDVKVICEKGICSDGVFDRDWNSYIVTELSSLEEGSREVEDLLVHLQDWVADLRSRLVPRTPAP